MSPIVLILDCYTAEPSGLGIPPFLSPYVRDAYAAMRKARPDHDIRYLTIDDVRWCLNGGAPFVPPPLTDRRTLSASTNRSEALSLLRSAEIVVVVAGEAVPVDQMHAEVATVPEIVDALAFVRGSRILLGPLVNELRSAGGNRRGLFDVQHTHSMSPRTWLLGSNYPLPFEELRSSRADVDFTDLVNQLGWEPIAEIGLYRGCTRRLACSFCSEPVKHGTVSFRDVADVLEEVRTLNAAGVRRFRLGQQACFFSYLNRDVAAIERLLSGIRDSCPDLRTLHIDNVDPLAAAAPAGRRIAELVVRYCTEGNCAPMGIDSFDPVVVERNALTCPPEVLVRAVANINEFGSVSGPHGSPLLLPSLNIVYGLPGETHRTHFENLTWLRRIVDEGYDCLGTNIRRATVYAGTALAALQVEQPSQCGPHFETWRADVKDLFDLPMKARAYPIGATLSQLSVYFVSADGSWHWRLGTHSLPVFEPDSAREPQQSSTAVVTGHAPGYVTGEFELASAAGR
jgi:radical SAM superfamily enzyme with C-terminal helix-hairpin-helix motif